jgi:transcriptional regulator with XRE-family HTH domain
LTLRASASSKEAFPSKNEITPQGARTIGEKLLPLTSSNIYTQSPDLDTVGGRLSRARDAVGLSPAELASRIGVKTNTIQGWESDRALPRANRLTMLAGVLAVSPSWLLHGIGSAPVEDEASPGLRPIIARLEQLKRLHLETGQMIGRIEDDLARMRPAE